MVDSWQAEEGGYVLRDPIVDVRFADVDELVGEGLAEGDDLEYKADLPDLRPDSAKKELLKAQRLGGKRCQQSTCPLM